MCRVLEVSRSGDYAWAKQVRPTSWDVLDFDRARGAMEGHIGEFQFVIDGSLSSTNRKKKLYRRRPVANRATPVDPERVNAAALCLHGLAVNLLDTFRALAGTSDCIDEPLWVAQMGIAVGACQRI